MQYLIDLLPRFHELYDTVMAHWDVGVYFLFLLGTAVEFGIRQIPTQSPDGLLTRAGKFIDYLLQKVPNRLKQLPGADGGLPK